jgi:hypothetical protein
VLDSTGYVFGAWYFVKHRDKFICAHFTTTKTYTHLQLASFNVYMFLWHSVVCVERCYILYTRYGRFCYATFLLFRPENTGHLWQLKPFHLPCCIILFDWYDVLYTGEQTDAGVGSGRRRRVLDWYRFRFSISLWNVFEIALRDFVVFSVAQMVLSKFDVSCACGSTHNFSHLNYMKPSCMLPYPRLSFARFRLG